MEEGLRERDGWKHQRQAAGGQYTAFHGLDLFWHIAVAIIVAAGRVGNSDDRFFEAFTREAHGLSKGAAEVEREIFVAIVG